MKTDLRTKGEFLKQVYQQNNNLTPHLAVEVAKDPNSPIHNDFEWDDTKAGYEYRLYQARTLIRKVSFVFETSQEPERFINIVNNEGEHSYHPETVVIKNPSWFESALSNFSQKIKALGESIEHLHRASQVSTEKEKALRIAKKTQKYQKDISKELQ